MAGGGRERKLQKGAAKDEQPRRPTSDVGPKNEVRSKTPDQYVALWAASSPTLPQSTMRSVWFRSSSPLTSPERRPQSPPASTRRKLRLSARLSRPVAVARHTIALKAR